MPHYVYILHSDKFDKFYIGQTDSIEMRLERHNEFEKTNSYTSKYRPWVLKSYVEVDTRADALKVERKLKALKSKKMIAFFADNAETLSEFATKILPLGGGSSH